MRRRGALRTATELERESRRIRRIYGLEGFELVERRPRTRDYILFVRQRNPERLRRLLAISDGKVVPTAPFRLGRETVIASFHGEERALRRVLERLRKEGLPFRVRRASVRPFLERSEPEGLTARQRAVLARAFALGYYEVPRRMTLTRLARLTGQSPPALGKMLRRAEGHLVGRLLTVNALEPAEGGESEGSTEVREN